MASMCWSAAYERTATVGAAGLQSALPEALNWLSEFWVPVAGAVAVAGVGAGWAYIRSLIAKRRARLAGVHGGAARLPEIPDGDRRNSTMLLGLGGSGKTTLIKNLLHDNTADPTQPTREFKLYSGTRQASAGGSSYWFHVADYQGQNLGTLISALFTEQTRDRSPMAFPYITSLVLIVDLVPPPGGGYSEVPGRRRGPDASRVQKHLREWTDNTLDAVFGALDPEHLRLVCLFVNKVDAMTSHGPLRRQGYIKRFAPLLERLESRCGPDMVFRTILGSAQTGEGLPKLEEGLMERSVEG